MFDLIVANYNNEKFLNVFFESIERSTILPYQVIFVDDCSTDNSLDIVYKFINKNSIKILLIKNIKNIGFAKSLNIALENISSLYFARLDPDDFVKPKRFEIQLNFLKANTHFDMIGTNIIYVLNGIEKNVSNVETNVITIKNKIIDGYLPLIHGSIMGKSIIFKDFKYNANLVPAEDYDLFAYLIKNNFCITNIKEPLTFVNIHENSVSNDLLFSTINKRYDTCHKYFNVSKNRTLRYIEYKHQYYYRKYLFIYSSVRYWYLIIASLLNPIKVVKKLISKI
jgi:glycosyltransferase involved in cell wall biosynthesis